MHTETSKMGSQGRWPGTFVASSTAAWPAQLRFPIFSQRSYEHPLLNEVQGPLTIWGPRKIFLRFSTAVVSCLWCTIASLIHTFLFSCAASCCRVQGAGLL